MKRILVAHDGSEHSDNALKKAVELAECCRACIIVMSVVPEINYEEADEPDRAMVLEERLEQARAAIERVRQGLLRLNLNARTMVRHGPPAEKIMEAAAKMKVDMLVVGSRGKHGAEKFLLGSVSMKIVEYAPCPVLVVK